MCGLNIARLPACLVQVLADRDRLLEQHYYFLYSPEARPPGWSALIGALVSVAVNSLVAC